MIRWLLCATVVATSGCDSSMTAPGVPTEVDAFVELMNSHRVSVGCAPLVWSPEVADVALDHSEDMVARDFFDHTNPDGDSPWDRMTEAGISFSTAAENIAYGYATGAAVLEGWLNSPGHRANIENCSLMQHGVGLHGTHWTHLFRNP